MNAALVALELRKNRLTLIGLALSFALVVPLSLLVGPRAGYGLSAAVEAGLILWTLAGLPLAAVVLGATAGAALRGADAGEAEAPFPESAATRVARGLVGALLQLLILAAATGLISAAVSPGWRAGVLGAGEGPDVWQQVAPMRGLAVYLALDLLATAYLAAYAFGHALAGGLVGAVLAAAECALLGLGFQFAIFFPQRVASFTPPALLAVIAALAAKAAAVGPLSARFERRRRLGVLGAAAAAGLLIAGLVFAAATEESSYAQLKSSLRLAEPGDGGLLALGFGPTEDDRAALLNPAVYAAGVPAETVGGGLVWIAADGSVRRLIPDAPLGRLLVLGPWGAAIDALHRDSDGNLFVVRRRREASGDKSELWAGKPGSGLVKWERALGSDPMISLDGGRAVLEGGIWTQRALESRCALSIAGGGISCRPLSAVKPPLPPSALRGSGPRRGSIAIPGRADPLRLPGRVPDGFTSFPPVMLGGKPAWFIPVERQDDQGIAVCRANGKCELVWKTGRGMLWPIGGLDLQVLADGTIVHQYGYDWDVVAPDGRFLPPIKSKGLFDRWPRPADAPLFTPRLVRRASGHDWILFEGSRLVEMDEASGKPARDWPLPVRPRRTLHGDGLIVLAGGLVLQGDRGPFFLGWDGTTKALRAP